MKLGVLVSSLVVMVFVAALIPSYAPVLAGAGPSPVHSIADGSDHSCGIRTSGTVACWGSNISGEAPSDCATNTADACYGQFSQIAASQSYTCGIRTSGGIACWGQGVLKDCATNSASACYGSFTQIAAGYSNTCAIRTDGTLSCWGNDTYNQAPSDCATNAAEPCHGTFTQITSGSYFICGLRTSGTVTCWGYNGLGSAPTDCATNAADGCYGQFKEISSQYYSSCGVHTDNTISCWGSDGGSQAPTDCSTNASQACHGTFLTVSEGSYHGCAIRTNHTVACWGNSGDIPDCTAKSGPCYGPFNQVSAGPHSTCAIRGNRTVSCWLGTGDPAAPTDCGTNAADGCYGSFGPPATDLRLGHDGGALSLPVTAPAGANGVDLTVKFRSSRVCGSGFVKPPIKTTWFQGAKLLGVGSAPCKAKKKLFAQEIALGWDASGYITAPVWKAVGKPFGTPKGFRAGADSVLVNICPQAKSFCSSAKSNIVATLWWTQNGVHLQKIATKKGTNQIMFEGFPAP